MICSREMRGLTRDAALFFSSRRRHTRYWRDWSSDVCSSDLVTGVRTRAEAGWGRFRGGAWISSNVRADLLRTCSRRSSRSEERRVGKECRSRWSPYHYKKSEYDGYCRPPLDYVRKLIYSLVY